MVTGLDQEIESLDIIYEMLGDEGASGEMDILKKTTKIATDSMTALKEWQSRKQSSKLIETVQKAKALSKVDINEHKRVPSSYEGGMKNSLSNEWCTCIDAVKGRLQDKFGDLKKMLE